MSSAPHCRFCLANNLLVDEPLAMSESFYLLGSIDAARPAQAIIVPHRHVETPFELTPQEWSAIGGMMGSARERLSGFEPDGYTIGWNVGAVAGQEIFHAHMHVIARFDDEESAGRGLHSALTV